MKRGIKRKMKEVYKKCIVKFMDNLSEAQLKVLCLLAQKFWLGGGRHE